MTDKDKRSQRSNENLMNLLQNSHYLWNIFFFRRNIWVLLQLVCRGLDQKKHKLKKYLHLTHLEPHDNQINHENTDLCHQYGISVIDTQTSLRKHPNQWGASRDGCIHRLKREGIHLYLLHCFTLKGYYYIPLTLAPSDASCNLHNIVFPFTN